jgi:hypothetical protein
LIPTHTTRPRIGGIAAINRIGVRSKGAGRVSRDPTRKCCAKARDQLYWVSAQPNESCASNKAKMVYKVRDIYLRPSSSRPDP